MNVACNEPHYMHVIELVQSYDGELPGLPKLRSQSPWDSAIAIDQSKTKDLRVGHWLRDGQGAPNSRVLDITPNSSEINRGAYLAKRPNGCTYNYVFLNDPSIKQLINQTIHRLICPSSL